MTAPFSLSDERAAEFAQAVTLMRDDEGAGLVAVARVITDFGLDGFAFGAVRNSGAWWIFAVPSDGDLDDSSTEVVAVSGDGVALSGSWDDVRQDDALILGRDAHFVGEFWLRWFESEMLPPFHLDADDWTGAVYGGDHSTFNVSHGPDTYAFQAWEHELWGQGPSGIRAGTWVSVEGEYAAALIDSDSSGCLWGRMSESGTVFLGRPRSEVPNPAELLGEVFDTLFDGGEFEISSLCSDFLTTVQLGEYLGLVSSTDPNFDADHLEVSGVDCTRTASDLVKGKRKG